jgi:hypothetical protein
MEAVVVIDGVKVKKYYLLSISPDGGINWGLAHIHHFQRVPNFDCFSIGCKKEEKKFL